MTGKGMSFSFSYTTQQKLIKHCKIQIKKKHVKRITSLYTILKSHNDVFSYFIHHNFNNSLFSSIFPPELQEADIIPIHKNKSKFDIESSGPPSILPILSKTYERCMFDQIYSYFNPILSIHQCGFRQGHTTHHSLLLMVKKSKKKIDTKSNKTILTENQKHIQTSEKFRSLLMLDLGKKVIFICHFF